MHEIESQNVGQLRFNYSQKQYPGFRWKSTDGLLTFSLIMRAAAIAILLKVFFSCLGILCCGFFDVCECFCFQFMSVLPSV